MQQAREQKKRHKYACYLLCLQSFDVSCKLGHFCPLPSYSFAQNPLLPEPFPVFVQTHTQSQCRDIQQTASVVSLWCIKTNISSLQINYQLSPWPASVISLSGSTSDGLYCVLPLPLDALTAISPSAVVFQRLIQPTSATLLPSCCVGERG